jgi:FMN-dependent NADH-azoreductase
MSHTILRVDSGADHAGSVTRRLADVLIDNLAGPGDRVIERCATDGLPVVTGSWVDAAFADGDRAALKTSDQLVDELLAADELVLVAPVYNFGVPAALKAWVDQVMRAGRTFRFDGGAPVGLVPARRAWIVTASGSTRIGSELDFNTPYLRAVLGFMGVPDVRLVAADGHLADRTAIERGLSAATAA